MFEVTKRVETVFTVEGQDFSDKKAALDHASWLFCQYQITKSGTESVETVMQHDPRNVIYWLNRYVELLMDNQRMVDVQEAGPRPPVFHGYIFDANKGSKIDILNTFELMDKLHSLKKENQKIGMIKVIRSCYSPVNEKDRPGSPGLLDSKNYVEETFFR